MVVIPESTNFRAAAGLEIESSCDCVNIIMFAV